MRIIGPLDLDIDTITVSIKQVNGSVLAKKYLLYDPEGPAGYKTYSYRLTQTDTALANDNPDNMKLTFTATKDADIMNTNLLSATITRTNVAQLTIPEDSSLAGFAEYLNDFAESR